MTTIKGLFWFFFNIKGYEFRILLHTRYSRGSKLNFWARVDIGGVQWRVARKIYFRDTEVPSEARKVKIGTEVNIC